MSAERTLFLHIGHGKTGTSFLQSVLAGSGAALAEGGLFYPLAPDAADAARGSISSGNGTMLDGPLETLARAPEGVRGVVFSSEMLFGRIREQGFVDKLQAIASYYGCSQIAVLLFIRNPIGHLSSVYQQAVKRRGYADDIDRYAPRFQVPRMVLRVLKLIDGQANMTATVHNYDTHKGAMAAPLSAFLNVDAATLQPPPVAVVNRSLSASELAVQRRLNAILGASGRLAADPLCENLPTVSSTAVVPSIAVQHAVLERILPSMEEINRRLPAIEHYRADIAQPQPDDDEPLPLTGEQLHIVVDSLAREIERLRQHGADASASGRAPPVRRDGMLTKLKRHLKWRT